MLAPTHQTPAANTSTPTAPFCPTAQLCLPEPAMSSDKKFPEDGGSSNTPTPTPGTKSKVSLMTAFRASDLEDSGCFSLDQGYHLLRGGLTCWKEVHFSAHLRIPSLKCGHESRFLLLFCAVSTKMQLSLAWKRYEAILIFRNLEWCLGRDELD